MADSRTRSKQEVLDALSDVVQVSPTPNKSSFSPQDTYSASSFSGQTPMTAAEGQPSVPTKDQFNPLGPIAQGISSGNISSRGTRSKEQPPPPPIAKSGMSKFSSAFKRQTPEEKELKRREKEKRMNKAIDESTIKSSRMDIIDRLDLSGIHGSSLFHHDSPYDACSPHSNRNTRRAPVNAFDHTIDPMTGQPIGMRPTNGSRPALSPLAAATMRKMDDSAADFDDESKRGYSSRSSVSRSQTMPSGNIPTLRMDSSHSGETDTMGSLDRDVDAERSYRQQAYYNVPNNVSKGKADVSVPNADIWGVSSEPWQDFAQPASADAGGLKPANGRRGSRRQSGESGGSGTASAASSVFDMEAVMTGKKPSSNRPSKGGLQGDRTVSDGAPKRSKSLIKKIRSARQNPNVPPSDDNEVELGALSINGDDAGRPRAVSSGSNNYLNSNKRGGHGHSPSSPPLTHRNFSSPMNMGSSLGRSGTVRAEQSGNDYHSYQPAPTSPQPGATGATGLGRNGSIFNRFRGNKNRDRGEVAAR